MEKAEEIKTVSPGKKIIPTFCHGCGAAKPKCGILCHVVDGKFVQVEGNPEAFNNWGQGCTSLCAKGHTGPQYVASPNRLKYPMKRVGERGEGKFVRITWDEALDLIAAKLKETKQRYGPESYGVLSPEFWPVLDTLGRRFLNVYGSPNYLHSAICATPRASVARATIGFSTWTTDFEKSKLIVNWGANPENSAPNQGTTFSILNAIAKGAILIDIRPMLDPLGSKADIWLPVRPGTDCALTLAFLNVIITEKLYDFDFVAEWCYGFDKLAEHVQQYPPEWAGPITGISPAKIREAARLIATIKPAFIKTGNGIGDQTTDATATIMATSLISAITGNLDVSGGYYAGPAPVGPSLIKLKRISTLSEKAPENFVEKLVAPETPIWYQKSGNWDGGPTAAYYPALMSILTGKPYPIRVLQASCTNPLSATRNPKKVAEALKKVDFFFVMDISWGPHVDYADVVLPACTSYEHSHQLEIKNRKEGTWIGIYNKVAEPLGESRSDWQFYLDLAVRMGYGADFWNGDMDACLREQLAPSGISLEELRASPRGILIKRTASPPGPACRRYDSLFKSLPHGKVQCFNEFIGGKPNNNNSGVLPFLPFYQGPPEGLAQTPELASEYPFIISDVHAYRLFQHSFFSDIPYLRELQPYPWIRINPSAAQKFGINDGDWIKVESPSGWCRFKAEYFAGIAPDVLMTRRGWCQPCEELGLPGYSAFDGGSEVNNLYNSDSKYFDKFHSQMPKQALVRISKCEAPPTCWHSNQSLLDVVSPASRSTPAILQSNCASSLSSKAGTTMAMNKRLGFSFDPDRCLKCWSCEIACKQLKGIKAGSIKLRRVIENTQGTFPHVSRKFLSISCRHCAKAPCVAACPQKAISIRDKDGIVITDNDKCIGCRSCLDACPFGIPQFGDDGTMQKCDMCIERLEQGLRPVCVVSCPTQALRWGTFEEISKLATKKSAMGNNS